MTEEQLSQIAQKVRQLAAEVREIAPGGYVSLSCSEDGGVCVAVHGTREDVNLTLFDPYASFMGYSAKTMDEADERNKETARLIEIGRAHVSQA